VRNLGGVASVVPMRFLDAKTLPGIPLITSVREANIVWHHLARVPGLRGYTIQRDHVHLLVDAAVDEEALDRFLFVVHVALNRHRRVCGSLWDLQKVTISRSTGLAHERRKLRYCSLNPCRAGHRYVDDPLGWPWSSHRDLVGLSLVPAVPPHPDPVRFHRYCTRDSELRLPDSPLPRDPGEGRIEGLTFEELLARVASLYRTTPGAVLGNARSRRLVVGAARILVEAGVSELARAARVHRSTVLRAPVPPPEQLAILRAVARDRRFHPWTDEMIRALDGGRLPVTARR